jgi:UDP-N-acetylmuramyl pentapeptide phosphotransferase/UDP-N-acetylglucosamine-1-phosphate transferase
VGFTIVLVLAAAVAWLLTRTLAVRVTALSPLTARNYRGLEVPAATGIAIVLGVLGAAGVTVLAATALSDEASAAVAASALVGAGAALGFGLLGLWDDMMPSSERGWGTHVRALRAARPTGGAVKLAGGAMLGVLLASAFGGSFWGISLRGALIALSANLVNLLDLRPGRAIKFWVIMAAGPVIATLVSGNRASLIIVAAAAAALAFLPIDLGERGMLGDVGANALGGVLGVATVAAASTPVEVGLVVVLLAVHVVADRPGLSRVIAATPPLAVLDRIGRAPERS